MVARGNRPLDDEMRDNSVDGGMGNSSADDGMGNSSVADGTRDVLVDDRTVKPLHKRKSAGLLRLLMV